MVFRNISLIFFFFFSIILTSGSNETRMRADKTSYIRRMNFLLMSRMKDIFTGGSCLSLSQDTFRIDKR